GAAEGVADGVVALTEGWGACATRAAAAIIATGPSAAGGGAGAQPIGRADPAIRTGPTAPATAIIAGHLAGTRGDAGRGRGYRRWRYWRWYGLGRYTTSALAGSVRTGTTVRQRLLALALFLLLTGWTGFLLFLLGCLSLVVLSPLLAPILMLVAV